MSDHLRVYKLLPSHFALEDVRDRRLKVSRLEHVLFPCKRHQVFTTGAGLSDPFEPLALNAAGPRLRRLVQETRANQADTYGLLSFSSGWRHPVMWGHYAAEHTGIALGFDLRRSSAVRHVRYVASRLSLTALDGLEPGERLNELLLDHLLFTKAAYWSYEDEIRRLVVLNQESQPDGAHHFVPFAGNLRLVKIIAGINCKTSQAEIESALDGYAEPVEIVQAKASSRGFHLIRNPRRC